MTQQMEATGNSMMVEGSRELAAMLKNLPKDERLRVEGIIIGIEMAHGRPLRNSQSAGKATAAN